MLNYQRVDPNKNCHRYIHPPGPNFCQQKCPGCFALACASATNNISTGETTGEEINDCVTSDGIDPTSKTERDPWGQGQIAGTSAGSVGVPPSRIRHVDEKLHQVSAQHEYSLDWFKGKS